MAIKERRDGQSAFGSERVSNCTVAVRSKAATPSAITLVRGDGTEVCLWVDNAGKLRIGTFANFVAITGGTIVGTQS